jgi:hypothetical protein
VRMRRLKALGILVLASLSALGQTAGTTQTREYPFPEPPVKAALQNIGAYAGGRLPSLEGFISGEGVRPEDYQRPYYEYKIELLPVQQGHTQVRVAAKVSAWYASSDGNGSYKTLESNGRLETDLLDRLGEYLENKSSDPAVLQVRIQQVRSQKLEAQQQLTTLQTKLEQLKAAPRPTASREFAQIIKPATTVWSTPSPASKALLKAQVEDQFEIREHRGAWLRVALDDSRDGWLQESQVHVSEPDAATNQDPSPGKTEFTIIREMSSDFSGDLAQLKGKRALYIWARPEGSGLNLSGNKLRFAQNLFLQRYDEISHASQNEVAGIVVIFLDQQGGVAAASLDDIRLLAEGLISQDAFLKKSSFDPPSSFPASRKNR